jgi:3-phosphoshikimate 1-carboxyvinyltransferase
MARIIEPLSQMGAVVSGRRSNTLPPIAIRGGSLVPLKYEMKVASAQVKSCLMLAGLGASGQSVIVEPAASRDHTERMIRYGGGRVVSRALADGRVGHTVEPVRRLQMGSIAVPGDFSSAAFLLVAALLVPGSEITVENVGLNQTRTALLDVLVRMGADIEVRPTEMLGPEPVGNLTARSSSLHAVEVGAIEVPNIIDELPLFLLAAARAEGISKLRGAAELRAKESDRLNAMAATLSGLGVNITEFPDGMDVEGTARPWRGGDVKAYGDHRIAMVGALAGLLSQEGTMVDDTACIDVSYPSFMDTIEQLGAEWTAAAQ